MFLNQADRPGKSAKLNRSRANRVNVVNLKLDDAQLTPPINYSTLLPTRFDILLRQHDLEQRALAGSEERLTHDERATLPYLSTGLPGEECDANNKQHSVTFLDNEILISNPKLNRNLKNQSLVDNDSNHRSISSHKYLTLTELKDDAIQEKNIHLGRPTRTTLLRDRQRRCSIAAPNQGRELLQKSNLKPDARTLTRYEAVTNMLCAMIPPGQSLHSFLSGARYNKANWIESLKSLDLASDLTDGNILSSSNVFVKSSRGRPTSVPQNIDCMPRGLSWWTPQSADCLSRAPPGSSVDPRDEPSNEVLPSLNSESTVPPQRHTSEIQTPKSAWEDSKHPPMLSDRPGVMKHDSSAHERVRFHTNDSPPGGVAHKFGHGMRPSSVRVHASDVVRPVSNLNAVMIQGVSIHGLSSQGSVPPTARDAMFRQTQADLLSNENRRSHSATTTGSSWPRVGDGLDKFDSLKVTGLKVSGASGADGSGGAKSSILKPTRVENSLASTEVVHDSARKDQLKEELMEVDGDQESVTDGKKDLAQKDLDHQECESSINEADLVDRQNGPGQLDYGTRDDAQPGDVMETSENLGTLVEEDKVSAAGGLGQSRIVHGSEECLETTEHMEDLNVKDNVLVFLTEDQQNGAGKHKNGTSEVCLDDKLDDLSFHDDNADSLISHDSKVSRLTSHDDKANRLNSHRKVNGLNSHDDKVNRLNRDDDRVSEIENDDLSADDAEISDLTEYYKNHDDDDVIMPTPDVGVSKPSQINHERSDGAVEEEELLDHNDLDDHSG